MQPQAIIRQPDHTAIPHGFYEVDGPGNWGILRRTLRDAMDMCRERGWEPVFDFSYTRGA